MKLRFTKLGVLLLICSLYGGGIISASQTQLDTVGENIQKLEGFMDGEEKRIDLLLQSQSLLYVKLGELNQTLSETAGNVRAAEERQEILSSEMKSLQEELDAVKNKQQEYQESMKLRIRYLYENGDEHLLALLLQADSFTDALNKSTYIKMLHDYDRKMLAEYQRLRDDISWKEAKLNQEQEEQAALEQELFENRLEAQNLITEISMSLISVENELEQAAEHAQEYESLIASQKEYERELEAEREREEALNLQLWNELPGAGRNQAAYSPQGNDLDLLAAIIECEAGGECYEGKLAVGSVVMNRIHSALFPNSMVEVLYQERQFTPVGSGRFAVVLARGADSNCYAVAAEVLAGKITLDCLFFRTNNGSKQGIVIGNHVFY